MKIDVFTALLEKHALGTDNIVTASYMVVDAFGRKLSKMNDFKISNIIKNEDDIIFDLIAIKDEKTLRIKSDCIVFIDGMDPARYADIYDLLPDGTSKKVGKKRGRKPKNQHIM